MGDGTGDLARSKVACVAGARRLEFVLTDGREGWDTPDPYGSGKRNYVIDSPGTYRLTHGRVQRLS